MLFVSTLYVECYSFQLSSRMLFVSTLYVECYSMYLIYVWHMHKFECTILYRLRWNRIVVVQLFITHCGFGIWFSVIESKINSLFSVS